MGVSVSMVTHHECVKVTVASDEGVFAESKLYLDGIVHELTTNTTQST